MYKVKSFEKISLANNTKYINPQALALALYYNNAIGESVITQHREQKGFYVI